MDDKLFAENLRVHPGAGLYLPHSRALAVATHCTNSSIETEGEINPQIVLRSPLIVSMLLD